VSDDEITKQEAMLRQYAEENGHANIIVYTDNGYSGLNLDRPAIRKLQADAETGIVGLIIVKDVARISRNFQDFYEFLDCMADIGVEVKFSVGDFANDESISAVLKMR
jgi:DNA invertase Pin-like site-specific DNA recombinase